MVNLLSKKIGSFISDCLITGFYRENKAVVLAVRDKKVTNGSLLAWKNYYYLNKAKTGRWSSME